MGTHPLTAPWCRTRCQRFTALCSRVPGSAGTGVPQFLATSDPSAVYLGAGLFPVLSFLPLAAEFCTVCAGRARPGVGDAAPSARSAMARHAGPRLPLIVKNLVPTLSSVFDSQRITTTAFFAEVRRGGGRCCLSVCLSVPPCGTAQPRAVLLGFPTLWQRGWDGREARAGVQLLTHPCSEPASHNSLLTYHLKE